MTRSGKVRVAICAATALLAAARVADAAQDQPLTIADIAGLWLSIDETQPLLWATGQILPMEELLLIEPSGQVENRYLRFDLPDRGQCLQFAICSDAPLFGEAQATIEGDRITFSEVRPHPGFPLPAPVRDLLQPTSLIATATWSVRLDAEGDRLTMQADGDGTVRILARIGSERLARLRAGFRFAQKSAAGYWRCFLTTATAGEPTFSPLGPAAAEPPSWFPTFLAVASYLESASAFHATAPSPRLNPEQDEVEVELVFLERFPDLVPPTDRSRDRRLLAKGVYLKLRAQGLAHEEAGEDLIRVNGGEPVEVPFTEAELATWSRAVAVLRDPDPMMAGMAGHQLDVLGCSDL